MARIVNRNEIDKTANKLHANINPSPLLDNG